MTTTPTITAATALADVYLHWLNNYLTAECWAEHNGLDVDDAKVILALGRKYHEIRTVDRLHPEA